MCKVFTINYYQLMFLALLVKLLNFVIPLSCSFFVLLQKIYLNLKWESEAREQRTENSINYYILTAQITEWIECLFLELLTRFHFQVRSNQSLENWYSQLLCLTLSIKGIVWRTNQQVHQLCRWEGHLAGLPPSLSSRQVAA